MVTALIGGALWAAHTTIQALQLGFDEPARPAPHPDKPWCGTRDGGRFELYLRGPDTVSGEAFVATEEGSLAGTVTGHRRGDEIALVLAFGAERVLTLEGEFSFDGTRLTLLDDAGQQILFAQA